MEADKRSIERQETAERYVRTLHTHYIRNHLQEKMYEYRTHYVRNRLQEKMYEYGIPNAVSIFWSEDQEIFDILKFRKISGGKVLEPGLAAKVFHSSARQFFRRLS